MRIRTLLTFFMVICSNLLAQTFSVTKGSVECLLAENTAIYLAEHWTSSKFLENGLKLKLVEPYELNTIGNSSRLLLKFSNNMQVYSDGKTSLLVDNFEQFIEKDGTKNIYDFVGNFRLKGKAEFILEKLTDLGVFSVQTSGADLEIKSTHFYIMTDGNSTVVECYEGQITFTDSVTFKSTTLNSGNYAEVYGTDGEKNTIIKIYPLADINKNKITDRSLERKKLLAAVSSKP